MSGLKPTATGLPLAALLSQVLIAFTIELDNEFECEMPHRTTDHGGSRHDPSLGIFGDVAELHAVGRQRWFAIAELAARAKTLTNLNGMQRWGYIDVEPGPPRSA